ncbi:hypothetical protein GW17_00061150 [Ensete ventricosum]|nr:hypothetical protein GW17_00061150 [Ensete ventricosum]
MVLHSWQWTIRHVSFRDHTWDARGNIVSYELLEIRQDGVKPCRLPRITHDGIAPRRCPGSRETTSHHNPRNDSTWYKAKRDAPCLAERTSKGVSTTPLVDGGSEPSEPSTPKAAQRYGSGRLPDRFVV